ncbi:MAG: hypothetical protein AB7O52_12760 [Planctomycetota bacterium]
MPLRPLALACTMVWFAVSQSTLDARTKLTTLPPRDQVRIDLADGRQALVEEARTINLVAGMNQVDFSWAGTHIHRESIQIRVVTVGSEVRVTSTSYPPGENALYWDVFARTSGPVQFRISYLIDGFSRRIDYVALASRDETRLTLQCRANLSNATGESFPRADLQLGPHFVYANREILQGQARRMLAFEGQDLPLTKTFVFDPRQGGTVRYFYTFDNSADAGLGRATLVPGKSRVYIRDDTHSETFLGEDWLAPVPVGAKAALYLGIAQDIRCQQSLVRDERENVLADRWYHQHQRSRWTLENFKDEPVELTIEQPMSGEWTLGRVLLMEEHGEREERREVQLPIEPVLTERPHNELLRFRVALPPTGPRKVKWNLYADWTLKNRGF